MSLKMAIVAFPICVGGVVNIMPSDVRCLYSFSMSSTPNDAAGMPCLKIFSWYVCAAGFSFGSSNSSVPSLSSGDTTVSHLNSPTETFSFSINPSFSV